MIFKIPRTYGYPITFHQEPYIRVGSHKVKLYEHPERAKKLWSQESDIHYERQICMHGLTKELLLQSLDYKGFFRILKLEIPENDDKIISALIQEKIVISADNRYHVTNLGALLFAKDILIFDDLGRKSLRVIFYDGKNRINAKKEISASKGYALGFEGLIKYLDENLPSHEVITSSSRIKVSEYPLIAIREIVVNALIHQDFSLRGTSPKIEVFLIG